MNQLTERRIFTIGHSNHSIGDFTSLLNKYGVEVLVDIRSHPYSKYAHQFDTRNLQASLISDGIRYLFLGKELGGMPEGEEFYDQEGRVIYSNVEKASFFQEGLDRLEKVNTQCRTAIMCSEENPKECHRRLLVGRALVGKGFAVEHIRGDGSLVTEAELVEAETKATGGQLQMSLFEDEEKTWKSSRSVLRKKPRPNSSVR